MQPTSLDRYRVLFQQAGVAQALVDLDGVITDVNDQFDQLAPGVVGQQLLAHVPDDIRGPAGDNLAALIRGDQQVLHVERRIPDGDGSLRDVLVSVAAICDTDGSVTELSVSLQDVTDLREAQREADRERARWQSLSQNASAVAMILDRDLVVQYASPSLTRLLGHADDAIGIPLLDLVHPGDRDRVATGLLQLVTDDAQEISFAFRLRNVDGHWRTVELRALNLLEDPHVEGLVLNLADVTARHELERDLRRAVLHDRLTGLPNRALTMDRIEQALDRARVDGPCTLLLVDIDHFAAVNDAYGYTGGDQVLRWAADLLSAEIGPADTVGRYGPDQFAVLLAGTEPRDAEALARKLTRSLNSSVELVAGTSIRVSACIGLSHGHAFGAEAVVSAAEGALARAKARGRAQCAFHDGAFARGLHGRSIGAELASAVAGEQLAVHYQPIVELRSGRISGFEALVRWPHEELGDVPPDTFLPIAESLDLHGAIDQWVLQQACLTARDWIRERGGAATTVSVNVSPRRLLAPGFVRDVHDALRTSGLPPTALVLEVTETAVVTDLELAADVLGELDAVGVKVSIDDFGTGYSSMLQLRQLPFSKLKIDREFVRGLPTSTDDLAICASVLSLATRLDVRTIAEGVETADQAAALRSLGCEYGQGFLWSPAVSGGDALRLLQDDPWTGAADVPGDGRARVERPPTDPVLVRLAQELHRQGASLHSIAAHLNRDGHLTASGRRWHARTVARLLFDAG